MSGRGFAWPWPVVKSSLARLVGKGSSSNLSARYRLLTSYDHLFPVPCAIVMLLCAYMEV
jgi:hypothetical protein